MVNPNTAPCHIERDDLSMAWGEALLQLLRPGATAIAPLTLSITGFASDGAPKETTLIRRGLERLVHDHGIDFDIETVAFTIFPNEYWRLANRNRQEFFELFRESFPRIQDWNARHNSRGTYFQRLIDYKGKNQLKWIIEEYRRNPKQRVSQFQATTYDPARDQTRSAQLEFPCLQHISFVPLGNGDLMMNAFYATQQILRKGYGNYLGLCRLGAFMAHEMGLRLAKVSIFVGVAKIDRIGKSDDGLVVFAKEVRAAINSENVRKHVA